MNNEENQTKEDFEMTLEDWVERAEFLRDMQREDGEVPETHKEMYQRVRMKD